jgi:hypothetical protein
LKSSPTTTFFFQVRIQRLPFSPPLKKNYKKEKDEVRYQDVMFKNYRDQLPNNLKR